MCGHQNLSDNFDHTEYVPLWPISSCACLINLYLVVGFGTVWWCPSLCFRYILPSVTKKFDAYRTNFLISSSVVSWSTLIPSRYCFTFSNFWSSCLSSSGYGIGAIGFSSSPSLSSCLHVPSLAFCPARKDNVTKIAFGRFIVRMRCPIYVLWECHSLWGQSGFHMGQRSIDNDRVALRGQCKRAGQ